MFRFLFALGLGVLFGVSASVAGGGFQAPVVLTMATNNTGSIVWTNTINDAALARIMTTFPTATPSTCSVYVITGDTTPVTNLLDSTVLSTAVTAQWSCGGVPVPLKKNEKLLVTTGTNSITTVTIFNMTLP
jgi:hydrogenase maturation factor